MTELIIKPVRYGILIGLLGLVFGIGWAFWLVLGHERIHKSLEKSVVEGKEVRSLIDIIGPDNAQANTSAKGGHNEHSHGQPSTNEETHQHEEEGKTLQKEEHLDMMSEGQHMMKTGEDNHPHSEGMHDNPIMELAHKRLVRGHLHLMGLGLLSVVLSLILGFTSAPPLFKTIASVFTGIGGIVYPIAWIVMGYMTPRLGADAAETYATVIAGPGVLLVTFGIVSATIFLLKDAFASAVKVLLLITLAFGLTVFHGSEGMAQVSKLTKVANPSYVCMVNNEVMGKPQIPVKVGDQTYYGCCKMCEGTLKKDRKARFAIDPVSAKEVDKAKAIIGAKPNGEVLYFESEETFKAFNLK